MEKYVPEDVRKWIVRQRDHRNTICIAYEEYDWSSNAKP